MGWRTLQFATLTLISCAARILFRVPSKGVIYGSDSQMYVNIAEEIARSGLRAGLAYPFHVLYSFFITPAALMGVPVNTYIYWLNLALSVLAVLVLFELLRGISSGITAFLSAVLIAVYPNLLFWFPYVLTETLFIGLLAIFAFSLFRLVATFRVWTLALFLVSGLALVFARPTGIVPLLVGILALVHTYLKSLGIVLVNPMRAFLLFALVLLIPFFIAVSPRTLHVMSRVPTLGQSLWLSTELVTNSMEETEKTWKREKNLRAVAKDRGIDPMSYKVQLAASFIRKNPGTYLGMALKRFVAFWFPWLFAESWSLAHRVLDALLSIFVLICSFLYVLSRARQPSGLAILWMAMGLAALSAFTQIDTDGRYRLPAEFLLLIIAVPTLLRGLKVAVLRKVGEPGLRSLNTAYQESR